MHCFCFETVSRNTKTLNETNQLQNVESVAISVCIVSVVFLLLLIFVCANRSEVLYVNICPKKANCDEADSIVARAFAVSYFNRQSSFGNASDKIGYLLVDPIHRCATSCVPQWISWAELDAKHLTDLCDYTRLCDISTKHISDCDFDVNINNNGGMRSR